MYRLTDWLSIHFSKKMNRTNHQALGSSWVRKGSASPTEVLSASRVRGKMIGAISSLSLPIIMWWTSHTPSRTGASWDYSKNLSSAKCLPKNRALSRKRRLSFRNISEEEKNLLSFRPFPLDTLNIPLDPTREFVCSSQSVLVTASKVFL